MKLVKIVLVLSNPISTAITLKINESDGTANSKWIYVFGAKINSDFGVKTEKMHGYTSVLFMRPVKLTSYNSKYRADFHQLYIHILLPSYTIPYIPNLKEIALAVPEIWVTKNRLIFFLFFFFAPDDKCT